MYIEDVAVLKCEHAKECDNKAKEYGVEGLSLSDCIDNQIIKYDSYLSDLYENGNYDCLEYSPCGANYCINIEKIKIIHVKKICIFVAELMVKNLKMKMHIGSHANTVILVD